MRTFVKYSPLQIAKHVAVFFKGQFAIAEKGTFQFDGGKVIINEHSSELERKVGKEVNKMIVNLMSRSRRVENYC